MVDNLPMVTHADIWFAIDALARKYGLTASALARRAGLDPTTFNKSKRITREGKPRWPSTESVAKVLEATGASLSDFVGYIDGGGAQTAATLPLIDLGPRPVDGNRAFDATGRPLSGAWDEIPFPALDDPQAWALEVVGDGLEPWLRDGDVAIVSPAASVRRGDRVVVHTVTGELIVARLARRSARRLELNPPDPAAPCRNLAAEELEWMARIVWVSQ